MKVAIYGGSFDPVHLGHLWVAQGCAERLALNQVIFVPTATSPLKPDGPVASDAQRVRMLQLALGIIAPGEAFVTDDGVSMLIDQREIHRGGASYSFDTVAELKRERPDDTFVLLVGSDAFSSIRLWHRPKELLALIRLAVFRRGGEPEIDWNVLDGLVSAQRAIEIRRSAVTLPMIELSSSEIRSRVAAGRNIRHLVPPDVATFIQAKSLYNPGKTL